MSYSQFEEDDRTIELIEKLNPPHMFMEIGCGNGSENCTRVLVERRWCGLWVDADVENTKAAIALNLPGVTIVNQFVTLMNLTTLKLHMPQEFGVLSIDVDGNDYWVWKDLCQGEYGLRPSIVIIEAQVQIPLDVPYVMPYTENYVWDHKSYDCGASLCSMVALGHELGYRHVGKLDNPHSPNLFFVRADLDPV